MSILTNKIKDYNTMDREITDPKASKVKAENACSEMKKALPKAEEKKRSASKPKMFKVDIKEEPKKAKAQSTVNMFSTGTVVDDFEDIGIVSTTTKKKSDDRDMELASINGGKPAFQLKVVDHSDLYKVEASNVLNLNPFQISFSENELKQYTYQNPMLSQYNNGFNKESF